VWRPAEWDSNPKSTWEILKKSERPNIFRHHDYREYLKDWLAYNQASQSNKSLRSIALEAGVSVSNFSMILSGSRKLSSRILKRLVPTLKLSRREVEYLEVMFAIGDAANQEERATGLGRLNRFKAYRQQNQKDSEVFRYLTHWYYVAIREMSALPGFQADARWVRSHLGYPVALQEVDAALKFLLKHGYIERNPAGSVVPPSKQLDCLGGIYKTALIQFHREMLATAGRSIDQYAPEDRNIVGYTLAVDADRRARINHLIEQTYERIRAIAQETSGREDSIYHVELGFFPLTKVKKNEEK
jgi:uncharacterized protein (TIGR02147 family)